MSFQKTLFVSLALGSFSGLAGCSAKTGEPDGAGGAGPAAGCDTIDYAAYKTAPAVSFHDDVMPVFGFGCTASTCHNSKDKNAKLDLGPKCQFDSATKKCIYPAMADPTSTQTVVPGPLTPEALDAAYTSLMDVSSTVLAGNVKRVVPGDPENSFLIQKTTGTQGQHGYTTCKSYDTAHKVTDDPCGDSMPLGNAMLCEGSNRPRFDIVATWIAQGAAKN